MSDEKTNLESIINNTPIGMILMDSNFIIKKVNESILKIFSKNDEDVLGYRFGEAFGCTVYGECYNKTSEICLTCAFRTTLEKAFEYNENLKNIEYENKFIINNELQSLWLRINCVPIHLNGEFEILVVVDDITQRKNHEIELERSRDFYLTLFEEFPINIWRTNKYGKCDYIVKIYKFSGMSLISLMNDSFYSIIHSEEERLLYISKSI